MRRILATLALSGTLIGGTAALGAVPAGAAPAAVEADAGGEGDHVRPDRPDRRTIIRLVLGRSAEAIGLPVEGLVGQLRGGASIAEVAERQGVPVDDVVAAIVAPLLERLDAAVDAGHIDAARADELRTKVLAAVDRIVHHHLDGPPRSAS